MNTIAPPDALDIGSANTPRPTLSREVAQSLLRACALPGADDRTYTSVQIMPPPSGQSLYVRSSFYG